MRRESKGGSLRASLTRVSGGTTKRLLIAGL
jgi:hypothetical protein